MMLRTLLLSVAACLIMVIALILTADHCSTPELHQFQLDIDPAPAVH